MTGLIIFVLLLLVVAAVLVVIGLRNPKSENDQVLLERLDEFSQSGKKLTWKNWKCHNPLWSV